MTDNDPISWRAIVYGTPVVTADGTKLGTVREVLGSDSEDIFHGIRVAASDRPDAVVIASDINAITVKEVTTGLSASEFDALPDYDETSTYHLASVGWLRKHLGWTKDSESDEEPG